MSDEEQKDAFAQREEAEDEAEDVEAHAFQAKDSKDQKDATEEPPDVEGHSLGAAAANDALNAPAAHGPLDQND